MSSVTPGAFAPILLNLSMMATLAHDVRSPLASIQMAPFEILGGAHPPDVRRGSRRVGSMETLVR